MPVVYVVPCMVQSVVLLPVQQNEALAHPVSFASPPEDAPTTAPVGGLPLDRGMPLMDKGLPLMDNSTFWGKSLIPLAPFETLEPNSTT